MIICERSFGIYLHPLAYLISVLLIICIGLNPQVSEPTADDTTNFRVLV